MKNYIALTVITKNDNLKRADLFHLQKGCDVLRFISQIDVELFDGVYIDEIRLHDKTCFPDTMNQMYEDRGILLDKRRVWKWSEER